MMDVVLGLDLGTSYFKAALVNKNGVLSGLGRSTVPVGVNTEKPWELDVSLFWESIKTVIDKACSNAGAAPEDICAVSYASQANSFLLLDEAFNPLTPIILWPDNRSPGTDVPLVELWNREDFPETTGMSFRGPGFAIAKILWLQKQRGDVWHRCRHIMTISDYLSYRLTGESIGDSGTSTLLGIYDLKNMRWWESALKLLNIPEDFLPRVYRPGTIKGCISGYAAESLGLKRDIPFVVGGLDHHIAALGAGGGVLSGASESTGTVLACYESPVDFIPAASSCLGPSLKEGSYYRLRFNNNGGRGVEWYRSNYAPDISLADLDAMAAGIPPGAEGLRAYPEVFRGVGLSRFSGTEKVWSHGHYFRAILESTAASLRVMLSESGSKANNCPILATGGGSASSLWLQIKADVTGREFLTSSSIEPAAFGAAMLASFAAGWSDSPGGNAEKWIEVKEHYKPDTEAQQKYALWFETYRTLCGV